MRCMLGCIHVCVFHSKKTSFKKWLDTSLIPPRHLLHTWWIDRESSCLLDSFLTPGGSIELLFLDLMSCSSIPQLSTTISWIPTSIASSTPLETCIYRALLRVYIYLLRNLILISSISLDLSVLVHLLNTLSLTPNLFLCDFSSFSKILHLLVSF